MLSHFKNFIKNSASDLFIVLVVILVALICFGIGRLTTPKSEPVLIKNLERAFPSSFRSEEGGQASVEDIKTDYQGKVVGSKNSDKYHLPDCPGAKQISEQNKIWFNSIEEAEKAGYKPAANCPGLLNK
jgi:hypothetical protein